MSNEHGGLLDVLREDGRHELMNIADRLEEDEDEGKYERMEMKLFQL